MPSFLALLSSRMSKNSVPKLTKFRIIFGTKSSHAPRASAPPESGHPSADGIWVMSRRSAGGGWFIVCARSPPLVTTLDIVAASGRRSPATGTSNRRQQGAREWRVEKQKMGEEVGREHRGKKDIRRNIQPHEGQLTTSLGGGGRPLFTNPRQFGGVKIGRGSDHSEGSYTLGNHHRDINFIFIPWILRRDTVDQIGPLGANRNRLGEI